MRNLLVCFLSLFLMVACRSDKSVTVGGIKVPDALRQSADQLQFDYTGQLAKALEGEEASLVHLLNFSRQVDSSNLATHGQVLGALLEKMGDGPFSRIISKLTPEARQAVWAAIESSGTVPLKNEAPRTTEALIPSKNIQEYRGLYAFNLQRSTFRDCADPEARYIAIDETGGMEENYRSLLRFPYPGQPVLAVVKGYKSDYYGDEQLPAKFNGFFVITEILNMEVKNFRNTCIPYEFWAIGTEPFWNAEISAGEGIIEFNLMEEDRTKVYAYQAPMEIDSVLVYAAINQETGDNIRVSVQKTACNDGMSDRKYNYKVELTMNGQVFNGCGITPEEAVETSETDSEQN